jgi:xanthine dehydrogenase iron-sulfur cluster and FAD-binding subunit A
MFLHTRPEAYAFAAANCVRATGGCGAWTHLVAKANLQPTDFTRLNAIAMFVSQLNQSYKLKQADLALPIILSNITRNS